MRYRLLMPKFRLLVDTPNCLSLAFIQATLATSIAFLLMPTATMAADSPWRYLATTKSKTIDQIVKSGRFKKYGVSVCAPKNWDGSELKARGLKFYRSKTKRNVRHWNVALKSGECRLYVMTAEEYADRTVAVRDQFNIATYLRPLDAKDAHISASLRRFCRSPRTVYIRAYHQQAGA